jgi:hypothetical protein
MDFCSFQVLLADRCRSARISDLRSLNNPADSVIPRVTLQREVQALAKSPRKHQIEEVLTLVLPVVARADRIVVA